MTKVRSRLGAGFVLALIAVVSSRQCQADEALVLQGSAPQLSFDDNDGTLQIWDVFGDNFGFDLIDTTMGLTPFHISPGALDHSFYVGTTGRIGFGTSDPQSALHVVSPSTPTFRLQQDASQFTPYTWDIAGNEDSFFVRDVTNSSNLPFRIRPGAPTSSLDITANGNVGFGTSNPVATIHVSKAGQPSTAEILAKFVLVDDPVAYLQITNGSNVNGQFIPRMASRSNGTSAAMLIDAIVTTDAGTGPAIAYNATKASGGALSTRPLVAYRNGGVAKATIAANGDITATAFNLSSSRTVKHDIVELESKKAGETLRQLTPVEFVYNDDESAEKRVGFIAEDVPELVADAGRKSVPVMDIVATLTRVVKDQQKIADEQKKSIEEQQKCIDKQQNTIDTLVKRLEALEKR